MNRFIRINVNNGRGDKTLFQVFMRSAVTEWALVFSSFDSIEIGNFVKVAVETMADHPVEEDQ